MTLAAATQQRLTITPVVPALGADITGIDLSQPLPDDLFEEIEEALLDRQVLFFRDQSLSPDQQCALARRFGDIESHHYYKHVPGFPEVSILEPEENPPLNLWHTDGSYRSSPPIGAVLYASHVPDCGGDTLWASLTAAYEALPDALKERVENLSARHDAAPTYRAAIDSRPDHDEKKPEEEVSLKAAVHPIVTVHPITGRKLLYVNPNYVTDVIGLSQPEGDQLLQHLYAHLQRPEFNVRFRWTPGAVAIWDNRATSHYAVQDYAGHYRRMHRVVLSRSHAA